MAENKVYRIYCSKCNKDRKSKMSWVRYLRYMATDRKSKGYQEIDQIFSPTTPTKCIFGHEIDQERTKIINPESPKTDN